MFRGLTDWRTFLSKHWLYNRLISCLLKYIELYSGVQVFLPYGTPKQMLQFLPKNNEGHRSYVA